MVRYPVSPEAEEEGGQRDGARIPGVGCLVIQGVCVKHSVDDTEAGQCWRPKGAAEMHVDSCHRSPDKRCCWPGRGPGWQQPKKVASCKTYVFQRENASTLLMG